MWYLILVLVTQTGNVTYREIPYKTKARCEAQSKVLHEGLERAEGFTPLWYQVTCSER